MIDLTGYVQKGNNLLLLDFPFETGNKAFAAEIKVQYFNLNRISFTSDQSWLMRDSYTYPTFLTGYSGFKAPEVVVEKKATESVKWRLNKQYRFSLPEKFSVGLNNVYLQIDYSGDKGLMYFNYMLVADNYYNGDVWEVGLNRLDYSFENQYLYVDIKPLLPNSRVYFDDEEAKMQGSEALINSVHLQPEYRVDWDISNPVLP